VLVEQTIRRHEGRLRRGVTPPKITLRTVAAQADAILVADPVTSPFLGRLSEDALDDSADRREALRIEAAKLLKKQALPPSVGCATSSRWSTSPVAIRWRRPTRRTGLVRLHGRPIDDTL